MLFMRPVIVLLLAAIAFAQPADLLQAARSGRAREIESALAAGAPVDARDLSGRTALMLAAENGHAAAVRLLLDRGADPQARDARGWTAYLFALLAPTGDALRAHESVLKLLPDAGRFRIAINVMWTPSESAYQSCFLKPEALSEQMRALRPDVVLLDVLLPDTTGLELAEALAAEPLGPAVVLTSSRSAADLGPALERSSARGFIAKRDLTPTAITALLGTAS